MPDLALVPPMRQLSFMRAEDPLSIVNAMREHQAMLDAIRDGLVNARRSRMRRTIRRTRADI